ncbi:aminoacyl-tRNA hydrolase [Nisaea acidiphila]|uniref:Peptidyl-tRNA hydrolase n=1 Tax=Nisaea acidiphila TaxID=1862145 RepID=A0A9J7B0Q5_9PROT|nr:aminoacyl-tRNA hydrolase [Nisaea acidiphila]UUX51269.1 aminoacyl-tRNA hydrolase [Nisaea acidiphila]
MFLFVGLGNPGPKYELTRHNIGFLVADEIASSYGFGPFRSRFQALTADGSVGGEKVLLMKPTTYMNESGRAVGEAVRFFKIPLENVIVFYDEIDLAPGKIRVKRGGGAGGHNGIRSIDAHVGKDYWRVRLGVGHPGDKNRVKDYVLHDFAKAEQEGWLSKLVPAVADEADLLVRGEDGSFMSRVSQAVFPQRPKPPKPKNLPKAETAGGAEDNSQDR